MVVVFLILPGSPQFVLPTCHPGCTSCHPGCTSDMEPITYHHEKLHKNVDEYWQNKVVLTPVSLSYNKDVSFPRYICSYFNILHLSQKTLRETTGSS